MQIWKYPIKSSREEIEIPRFGAILTVQMQRGIPTLWALVDPNEPKRKQKVLVVGTGHEFDASDLDYVGTFQLDDGDLVFHVFYEIEK